MKTDYADALTELFRQQVDCGFVLGDPSDPKGHVDKEFVDDDTGVTFSVQWNPKRSLRGNHEELIKRGIISPDVDPALLINKDENGVGCYLCRENIKVQNPKEVTLEIPLAGREYFAGANIAPITENHFTVMSGEHRPQPSAEEILPIMAEALDITGGQFTALYNGLAGASIENHEHFHLTTARFPIEEIQIRNEDAIRETENYRVVRPKYYLPLWIVESADKAEAAQSVSGIISAWHTKDAKNHTENIIMVKNAGTYRVFVFLRDRRKLKSPAKAGMMAAFECGGIIVLSDKDKELFQNMNLRSVAEILQAIAP